MHRRLPIVGALLFAVVLVIPSGTAAATAPPTGRPVATVAPEDLASGQSFVLRGQNFPPGATVRVAMCTFAPSGPALCDTARASVADVSPSGDVALRAGAGTPPGPCPCFLQVSTADGAVSARIPVNLNGVTGPDPASIALQAASARGSVRVTDLHFRVDATAASLFGGSTGATLVFTVENTGSVAVADPPVLLAVRSGDGTSTALPSPSLGQLAPGEHRTVRVAVPLGSLAFGSYEISGHVIGLSEPVEFTARTSSYPFGLLGLIGLTLAGTAWVVVRIRQRRRRLATPTALALPGPTRALGPGPAALPAGATAAPATGAPTPPTPPGATTDLDLEQALVLLLADVIPTLPSRLREIRATQSSDEAAAGRVALAAASQITGALTRMGVVAPAQQRLVTAQLRQELEMYVLSQRPAARAETGSRSSG